MPVAGLCRERRLETRHAALSLKRFDQRRFLAADERTRARLDAETARKIRAENVIADIARRRCVGNGFFETLDRERVLRAHVDNRFGRADGVCADQHAFDQRVRVALDDGSVHERAGVALVGVADQIFGRTGALAGGVPFEPGREACAAASRETGYFDFFNDFFRRHFGDSLPQRGVSLMRHGVVEVFRVDQAAVAQRDARLLVEKRAVLGGNFQGGNARFVARLQILCDRLRVFGLHAHQTRELAVVVDVDDRLKETHADAAGHRKFDVCVKRGLQRVVYFGRAGGNAA